ncbi:DUF6542 domain-containing protein [Nocardia sp. NPDC056100]|uniref:DUF6542 domain-containing protein n=1 Tax=Nocardia sp. NPDC056100 TaxID=3345712 RepID=UPI0035D5FECF
MAVTQRERAEVPPSHRSILPTVPGVPAGAAVLTAVTCTFIGFLIDTMGGDELTGTFASLYVIGCVLAALIVRYRGLFTTMVVPPLLLFLAVPLAYQQMLGNSAGGFKVKEILLNLAIPLVNRFPTMALATVLVLIIGAIRVAMHRREQQGDSGGASFKPRARTARPAGAARAQRAGATDTKEPARRRFRSGADEQDGDAAESTAATRRPAGRVASRPPRVGADRQPASGQAAGRQSTARQSGNDRKRTPPADRKPNPDRKPTGDRKPPGERRANPADRAERANPADRANPAGTEGRRRRAQTPEMPPHPRPNVRYRERDSGRIER